MQLAFYIPKYAALKVRDRCWLTLAILLSAGAGHLSAAPANGNISSNALEQIRELELEKSSRSALHQKLDSQFVYQLKQNRHEAFAPSVKSFHPDIKFAADGRVLVDIEGNVTAALLARITNAGGQVVSSVPQFHAIRALVPLAQTESLAGSADVKFIQRAVQSRHFTGSVESQGDITHGANLARTNYGVTGSGVKVGVISDSVTYLANSQANGNLPTNVTVLSGQSGTNISGATGEGTAMLEIVNDVAPGAQLYFATAFISEASFAQNILNLRSSGCNIIVDDVAYFDESPFQDGIVAQAVNTVTASGALYFSAAGNGGNKTANTAGTWEGDFVDGGAASSPITDLTGRLHNFGSATYNTVVGVPSGGVPVVLFWADPWGASSNDYDLYVLDSTGTTVLASSTSTQSGAQNPWEYISSVAANSRIVIVKSAGANRYLHLQLMTSGAGSLATSTPGAIAGHCAATNAFAVAAVDANTAYPNLFTTGNTVQYFSSDGPRRVFFNADGSPITPGNFSATGGTVRQKPDIAAANGVATSVTGFQPFYGTSAAAPHAAAIAALLLSCNSNATPAQVRTALNNTALDLAPAGADRDSGAGIIMAGPALNAIAANLIKLSLTNASLVAESCSNNVIDPGETVTLNFTLRNTGGLATTNLVATLLATNGVTGPSGPQNYGAITGAGATATRAFSFTANGSCGGSLTANLQLQDGATNLGLVSVQLPLGQLIATTSLTQSFDGVTAPALPAGWTTTTSGGQALWVTSTNTSDTAPVAAFTAGASTAGVNELVSPGINILSTTAQLTFRQNYNLQNTSATRNDGGVLEIKIGTNSFTDIQSAGGNFVTGGYIRILGNTRSNPLGGRSAWTGNSGGFITTTVNLPASAAGQTIQLKWRCGTDNSTASTGWYVDTIAIADSYYNCCSSVAIAAADLALGQSFAPTNVNLGSTVTFTLSVTNLGPDIATNTVVSNTLPAGLSFVSAAPAASATNGSTFTFALGNLTNGAKTNVIIQATALTAGAKTNLATAASATSDPTGANNSATAVVAVNSPPTISAIGNVTTNQFTAPGPIAFTVGDAETAAGSLTVSGASSNTNFVPNANIAFGGSGSNRTVTLTPAANQFGVTTVTVTVSDGQTNTSTAFTFTVNQVLHAPVVAAITNRTLFWLNPLAFTVSATSTDVPPQTLLYSLATNAPAGAAINATNGAFTWTPAIAQAPTTNLISVIVADNGAPLLTTTQSFTVTVLQSNLPPVLTAISDRTIYDLNLLAITNSATDTNLPAQTLTFALATNAPAGATITTNGIFTWTPTFAQSPSTNLINVIVTDSGTPSLSTTQTFSVTVLQSNLPPALTAISNATIYWLNTLTLTNSATDSNTPIQTLTFSLATNAPAGATVTTNGVFTWSPATNQAPSTNLISVIVTDDGSPSLSVTQSFTVTVLQSNLPPSLASIPDTTIHWLNTLAFTNSATDPNLPAQTLTFALATNAPAGATITTNGVFTWTPATNQAPSTNLISVIVTDDGSPSLSATQSFTVTVLQSNLPPMLAAISNATIYWLNTLAFTNSATDPNLPAQTLTFALATNAPAGATITTNGVFTWTPATNEAPSTNLISVIVADDGTPSLSTTQSFTVTVLQSNLPPVVTAIADRTVHAGSTVQFTNSATDPNLPAQDLTFMLDPIVPPGATLTPNGGFNWTPGLNFAGTTNDFTVRVTDDGTPPLSDTKSFAITVVAPPTIVSGTLSNDLVTLEWTAIPGQGYRMQLKPDLTLTNWTDVPGDVTATNTLATGTNAANGAIQQFYRVLVLP